MKRTGVLDWWDNVFSNRLSDYQKDTRVIIHQRVHEKDLIGHLLERGGYEYLCLPTEFDPERKTVIDVPGFHWEDPRKEPGELLFPARFGPKEVAEAKLTLGPTGYAGQHQQRPSPSGGGRFKSRYFKYFKTAGGLYQLFCGETQRVVSQPDCWRFAMMDPAGTEKNQNNKPCYTVIQVWDVTPDGDMLLIHQYREQIETPEVAAAAHDIASRYEVEYVGVEKDGIGLGVVQYLSRMGVAVMPIKARGNKEARSETAEIRMSAGKVFFPHGAPFVAELEKELLVFPNGEFLDQADCLSHSCAVVQNRSGPPKLETSDNPEQNEDTSPWYQDEPVPAGLTRRDF